MKQVLTLLYRIYQNEFSFPIIKLQQYTYGVNYFYQAFSFLTSSRLRGETPWPSSPPPSPLVSQQRVMETRCTWCVLSTPGNDHT